MVWKLVQNYTTGSMTNQKLSFIIDGRDNNDNSFKEELAYERENVSNSGVG